LRVLGTAEAAHMAQGASQQLHTIEVQSDKSVERYSGELAPTFRIPLHYADIFGLIFQRFCQANYQAIEKWSVVALTCGMSVQLETLQYPAWVNQPYASDAVTAANASAMASSRASRVRAAFARRSALILDQHSSIGEKSGE
jgi:hypothetical protein